MSTYIQTSFGRELVARLRGSIARYDINQEELAVLCEMSQSQFSKVIRGVRPMTLDHFIVICEALDILAAELVTEVSLWQGETRRASPIRFVEDDEHTDPPMIYDMENGNLDKWGKAALPRVEGHFKATPSLKLVERDLDEYSHNEFNEELPHAAHTGVRKADAEPYVK